MARDLFNRNPAAAPILWRWVFGGNMKFRRYISADFWRNFDLIPFLCPIVFGVLPIAGLAYIRSHPPYDPYDGRPPRTVRNDTDTGPWGCKKAVEDAGYTDVEIGGWAFMAGSKDDSFAYNFTAKNPLGVEIHGVVSGGPFKGWTVRMR